MRPIPLLSTVKTRYWLSFTLFVITYINLGWVLSEAEASRWMWVFGIGITIILAEALASPWSVVRGITVRWLKSDIRGFLTALAGAFIAVIFLTWLGISSHILLLVAAGLLLRLDAQIVGLSDIQALFLMLGTAAASLGVGWLAHFVIYG